jgi:4-hydroxy-2-oxoheptanedioate aldolase
VPAAEPLADRLGRGAAFGAFLNLPSADLAELVALAGFDCLVIDFEHGPMTVADVVGLTRAAHAADTAAVVRLPAGACRLATISLDCGVDGLIFAAVESGTEAASYLSHLRYPPHGDRGVSFYTRAGRYTIGDREAHLAAGREGPFTLMQIESRAGLAEVEAILAVDGVDGAFFGPTDYGVESDGDANAASVDEAAATVLAAAHGAGRRAAIFAADGKAAAARTEQGFDLVTVGVTPLVARALTGFLGEARP